VKWTGYDASSRLDPEVDAPGRTDIGTGGLSVSQGWRYAAERNRQQVNGAVTHHADAFGQHDFKFGMEIERSKLRSQYGYNDDIRYVDLYGAPYLAYSYGYDVKGDNRRESLFAQDGWRVGAHVTLTPGLRVDMLRGYDGASSQKVYSNTNWAPRIGLAFDPSGKGTTVIRGHFGQFYEGLFFSGYSRAVTGASDFVVFENDGTSLWEVDRSPPMLYRMDPKARHPRLDQWTVGVERSFARHWRVSATGIHRSWRNLVDSVLPDARWAPTSVPNALAGGDLVVYDWINEEEAGGNLLLSNPDGFVYRDGSGSPLGTARAGRRYRGLMFVLSRRLADRWQARFSYVLSKADGTVDNGTTGTFGGSRAFETPTLALVNSDGEVTQSPRHEVKFLGGYTIPKLELALGLSFRHVEGKTFAASGRFSSRDIAFPYSAGRQPLLEPRGSRRAETEDLLDLRLEKIVSLPGDRGRLSFYGDITNVFGAGTVTSIQSRYPSLEIPGAGEIAFGSPMATVPPRQIRLGLRWAF
jgi:hypothetical protein